MQNASNVMKSVLEIFRLKSGRTRSGKLRVGSTEELQQGDFVTIDSLHMMGRGLTAEELF